MALLVYSVVRRHMKRTNKFTVYDGTAELPANLSLLPEETLIGWYRNPPPWENCLLVFTSESIYTVEDGRIDRVAIRDIMGHESPESKEDVSGIRVRTPDGWRFIRAAGSYGPGGKYKDAFDLLMVIMALERSASEP